MKLRMNISFKMSIRDVVLRMLASPNESYKYHWNYVAIAQVSMEYI